MAWNSFDINEIVKREIVVSVKVEGMARFRFRLAVAIAIMRLAGWISPAPFAVEIEHEARS